MRLITSATSCAVAVALSLTASVAFAKTEAKQPVSIELSAYQITTNPKGETSFQPVNKVKPNDVIEYRATYTNNTAAPIKNLNATLPIPADTQFLAKSSPAAAQASTDGVNFAATPLKRKVGTQTVNVPLQEYRALRWTIAEILPGKSVTVTAQTRVNSVATASN